MALGHPRHAGKNAALYTLLFGVLLIFWNIASKPWPEEEEVKELANERGMALGWLNRYPPDFELDLDQGQRFSLAESVGKQPILLTFFATWCAPCKEELAELKRFAPKAQQEKILIVAIDLDEKADTVRAFVRREHVPFPVGIDQEENIARSLGVKSVPTSVFIGLDGRVALYQVGAITNAEIALQGPIEEQRKLRASKQQITAEEFRRKLAEQAPFPTELGRTNEPAKKPHLDESQRAFAAKLRCANCDQNILKCGCEYCLDIQRRLAAIDVKGKGDDQVLHELYLVKGEKAVAAGR